MKKSKALMSVAMIGLTVCIGLTATPTGASARKAYHTYTASRTSTTSVDTNLSAAKSAAKALNPYNYVDFSAVTKALAMPERTTSQKLAKTTAINNAINSLVKKVDASLAAAKSAAGALNSTDYVDFSAVTNALAMPEGTDAEKATKTLAINSAISSLVKKSSVSADLTVYNSAIAAVKQADYTASSWSTYQAVVAANSVTTSNTQAEVDAAAAAIKAAQAKLVKVVDANLAAAKAAAAALNANDYVDFSVVANALAMAEGTDAEKAAKTSGINSAISSLVKKSSVIADLAAYNAALAAVKQADYTASSWSTYQAVVAANSVTASNAQAEVDAAAAAIKAAQAKLMKMVDANLAAAKAAAAALNANDYVDFSKVTNALAMAEGTDAEKAAKTSAINSAISALVKKSVAQTSQHIMRL